MLQVSSLGFVVLLSGCVSSPLPAATTETPTGLLHTSEPHQPGDSTDQPTTHFKSASTRLVESAPGEAEENARRGIESGEEPLCPWSYTLDTQPLRHPATIHRAQCIPTYCARCTGLGGTWSEVQYPLQVLMPRKEYNNSGKYTFDKVIQMVPVACVCFMP